MSEDEDQDEQEHMAAVAERLRSRRRVLAMTVYAIQHGRRTPEQVRSVLDRADRAIHRNKLVRTRWIRQFSVH